MKKVFSLFLATVLAMGMFAQSKKVATVEKLWSGEPLGWATADSRQWTGFGEYVYWCSKANHAIIGTKDGLTQDTIIINAAIDGTAFCVDGAGNWIVEGTFPGTPSHIFLVKHADTTFVDIPVAGLGRTDIVTATGDVFSADGGVVFLYGNSVNLLAVAIKNAGAASQEVKVKTIAIAGSGNQNFVVAGDTLVQYVQRRTTGQTGFDKYENGVNLGSIEGMTGYKHTTLGGALITLSGKDFAVYPSGKTNYSSEFSVANLTDGGLAVDQADATKTVFCANTLTRFNTTNVGVFVNATKIDEDSAYIQVGNGSDGTAIFKLKLAPAAGVTVSCDENQGVVTGGGAIAVGGNAKVEAVAKPGFEFVAWMNGTDTVAKTATYTFAVSVDVALTAVFEAKENVIISLAVNDTTMGSISMPDTMSLGDNSVIYGSQITLTAVPATGLTFMGWFKGEALYSTDYEITLNGKESISLEARFVNVLFLSYELNGGVTNDSNWVSKGDLMLEIQNDYNAKYNGSLAVVKEANGVYYFKIRDNWVPEADAIGEDALVPNFFQNKTWSQDQKCANLFLNNPKYQFLVDLIDHFKGSAQTDRGTDSIHQMEIGVADAYFRADVSGFMLNSPATTGYPYTCNWTLNGQPDAYVPVWKHAFANPTEIVTEVTLNAPYKEEYTFDGWYATADFSGEKITKVSPESEIAGNKLYAKWIEYIPTLAEVTAMEENTETKAKGVVTYINGKNAYIQDASAGMLLYCKNNPTFQVGQEVVVKGTKTLYGGAPELKNVEEIRAEAGTMPNAVALATLAAAKADPLKYFGQLISFKGLTIVALDNYKNPSLTDGVDTVACYKMSVDDALFPVGTKVNVTAISGYFNGFQLVGDPAGIVEAGGAGKDSYVYPALGENGEYTLTNKWIFSNIQDNFVSNKPAPDNMARGMVAKDGKMYFINRNNGSFTVVDGATGKMSLDPIMITGEHLFEALDTTDNTYKACATLAFNDVKLDQAGHFLIGGCVSGGNRMQVYKVDITTGAATVVVDDRLYDYADFELEGKATAWRFDAFNVYGDVDNHAIIMAADANSFYVYKWEITNGVAGEAEQIDCQPVKTDKSLLVKDSVLTATAFGTAPQIFPVDFDYFYVDGWNTLPMLYDMEGTLMEDFATVPSGVSVPMAGDTCIMNTGHNGLCEFQIGNEYYLIMAATNTVGAPTSAFALYKFADENKSFAEMTPMWFFPHEGMGAATNGCRTAVPSVEVKDNVATLYVYTNNNGYGVYEMTGVLGSAVENVVDNTTAIKAEKRIENGILYIIRNGVRYNAQGVVAQ